MKKLIINFPVFLILLSIFFGCAQEIKETDMEADIAAIKAHYDKYFISGNANDLDLFISLWTDDAIRMEPSYHAVVGKEKIRAFFKDSFEKFEADIAPYGEIQVEVCGDMAYSRGTYVLKLTPKEGGETFVFDGKWLDILKRQDDGSWKIYIDCINKNPDLSDETFDTDLGKDQDMSDPIL